jgi:hypothetical protein
MTSLSQTNWQEIIQQRLNDRDQREWLSFKNLIESSKFNRISSVFLIRKDDILHSQLAYQTDRNVELEDSVALLKKQLHELTLTRPNTATTELG